MLLLLVCFCPKLVDAVSVNCLLPAGAGVILDGVLLDGACGCQCVLLEFAAGWCLLLLDDVLSACWWVLLEGACCCCLSG